MCDQDNELEEVVFFSLAWFCDIRHDGGDDRSETFNFSFRGAGSSKLNLIHCLQSRRGETKLASKNQRNREHREQNRKLRHTNRLRGFMLDTELGLIDMLLTTVTFS